jgi:MoxR-like ATPase
MNPSNTSLPRDLRNAVRSAITAQPGWELWRGENLEGRSAADMRRGEILLAANAFNIDIAAIAASLGAPSTQQDTGTMETAPASLTARDDAGALPMGGTLHAAFEGRDPESLVNEALAGVEGMIGSKLVAMLQSSIAPLAQAASQGPRVEVRTETREVVKTVTVDASGQAVAAPAGLVNLVEMREGKRVFAKGLKAKGATRFGSLPVPVCDGIAGEGDVPAHDATYVWQGDMLGYLCAVAHLAASNDTAKRKRASALLYGPAGTGKTSAVECFAAACGRPFYRIAIDRNTEGLELIGQRLPVPGGGTVFHEGALVTAMQVPFAVILIDEPSFLRPGTAAVLQTILDKRYTILKEDKNRRVEFAEGVMVVLADNTNLCGDETGRYADTIAQNVALQDRVGFFVPVDYLPAVLEAQSLSTHSGLALAACERMVTFAGLTRHGKNNGTLTTGTSYRRLLAWADAVALGAPSQSAFNASIINPADAADRPTLAQLENANSNMHADIDTAAAGGTVADPVVQGNASRPQNVRAADAFADAPPVT